MKGCQYSNVLGFPSTHWSSIGKTSNQNGDEFHAAVSQFVERYSPALKAYLRRAMRLDRHAVEDLFQEFVASKVLGHNIMAKADRELGKFRTFLLTTLRNFVLLQLRGRSEANTRIRVLCPEQFQTKASPIDIFDIEWARVVMKHTVSSMFETCQSNRRNDLWELFNHRLLTPILRSEDPWPYDRIAKEFGFDSALAAANALTSAKRMFRRILQRVVGEYCHDEIEIDREIADLFRVFASRPDIEWDDGIV